jgi:hypothetical protein
LASLSPADTITGNCYYFLNFSAVKHRQNNNRLINLGILGKIKNYQVSESESCSCHSLMKVILRFDGGDSNAIDIFTSERERSEALSAGGSCHKSS